MQANNSNDSSKSAQPNNPTITETTTQSNSFTHSDNSSDSNITENLFAAQLTKSSFAKQPSSSIKDEPVSSKRYKHCKCSNKNSSGKNHEDESDDLSHDETNSKFISKRTKKYADQRQNEYISYYYPNRMIQQQLNQTFPYYPNDIVELV